MAHKSKIYRLLNIEREEKTEVFLLILYSFFSGAAQAFFVTGATSLFLNSFDREMLPVSFIVAGVIVWITGKLYSYFQKNTSFSSVLKMGLGFLLTSVLIFVLLLYKVNAFVIIFILYAWIRIFAYLHGITFWGLAGRMFSLRQAKRLFGLITGGEVFGGIISFFSVPFLLKIISTEDILIISGATLIPAFIILIYIVNKYKKRLETKKNGKNTEVTGNKKSTNRQTNLNFTKNRYLSLFFFIALLPVLSQFFVDFIFQAQAKIEFPVKAALTAFVGIFFGVSSIVEFILKVFASGRLMDKYGVKFGLLAFPVMLLISFILALFFGVFYGATSFFFSFVTAGRLFTRAVRTAFNDPATQILYQPLPSDQRLAFQNKIESGPKAYAGIVAGVLLLIFVNIKFFTLVWFAGFLVLIILFWTKKALGIFKEYKIILQNFLSSKQSDRKQSVSEEIINLVREKLEKHELKNEKSLILFYNDIYPFQKAKKKAILMKIEDIVDLSNSQKTEDRISAAHYFSKHKIYKIERSLIKLLNDPDMEVRRAAVISAGLINDKAFFDAIINNLRIPQLQNTVIYTILHIGERILPQVSNFFYKQEHDSNLQIKIIEIFEQMNSKNAAEFLRRKINYPNKNIRDRVIEALGAINYNATRKEAMIIEEKLEIEIQNFIEIVATLNDLKQEEGTSGIVNAVNVEQENKKQKILAILSVLYDSTQINIIKNSFASENADSHDFAVEIADTIFSDYHKELILPVFENLDDDEILRRYKMLYNYKRLSKRDRLFRIINSEKSVCGDYIKSLAIKMLGEFSDSDVVKILNANIVHPSTIIRESAMLLLYEKYKSEYDKQFEILLPRYRSLEKVFDNIEQVGRSGGLLFPEKIKIMKSLPCFLNLREDILFEIAENSKELIINEEGKFVFDKSKDTNAYIIVSGLFETKQSKQFDFGSVITVYNKNGDDVVEFTALEHSFILETKLHFLHNIIIQDREFAEKFINEFSC